MTEKLLPNGRAIKDGKEYGCHCDVDVELGLVPVVPDGCVIDQNAHGDCVYARTPTGRLRKSKWSCKYWKVVKI